MELTASSVQWLQALLRSITVRTIVSAIIRLGKVLLLINSSDAVIKMIRVELINFVIMFTVI